MNATSNWFKLEDHKPEEDEIILALLFDQVPCVARYCTRYPSGNFYFRSDRGELTEKNITKWAKINIK